MLFNLLPSICFPFWNAGCKLPHSRVRWYVQRQQQNDNNIRGLGEGRNALPIRPNHNNTLTSQFQTDAIKNELTKRYAKKPSQRTGNTNVKTNAHGASKYVKLIVTEIYSPKVGISIFRHTKCCEDRSKTFPKIVFVSWMAKDS